MITNKYEAKTMTKHISSDSMIVDANLIVKYVI